MNFNWNGANSVFLHLLISIVFTGCSFKSFIQSTASANQYLLCTFFFWFDDPKKGFSSGSLDQTSGLENSGFLCIASGLFLSRSHPFSFAFMLSLACFSNSITNLNVHLFLFRFIYTVETIPFSMLFDASLQYFDGISTWTTIYWDSM